MNLDDDYEIPDEEGDCCHWGRIRVSLLTGRCVCKRCGEELEGRLSVRGRIEYRWIDVTWWAWNAKLQVKSWLGRMRERAQRRRWDIDDEIPF